MQNAQQLRTTIESQLANRIPSALTPVQRLNRETIPTGIPEIDKLTNGGLPLGGITEIIGSASTGRTTLAMSLLAHVSRSENVCAWIDATDEFDIVSAAANGIVLQQLLLVRCGAAATACNEQNSQLIDPPADLSGHSQPNVRTHCSNHPRNEGRGLGEAVGHLFQQKLAGRTLKPGTPGAANIKLSHISRDEQITSDRLPSRRGNRALQTESVPTPVMGTQALLSTKPHHNLSPWQQIDRSIRITDLLLQYGGFQAIVLDLASFEPEIVSRIPLATWFRFRSLVDAHHSCLALLTQHPCARSSTALSLQLADPDVMDDTTVMTRLLSQASVYRQRFETTPSNEYPLRKGPQSERKAQWTTRAAWAS